jgi:hypothetical protein
VAEFFIFQGTCEDNRLWLNYLAIDALQPVFAALGRSHAKAIAAAPVDSRLAVRRREAMRDPRAHQVLTLDPNLEDEAQRHIERRGRPTSPGRPDQVAASAANLAKISVTNTAC